MDKNYKGILNMYRMLAAFSMFVVLIHPVNAKVDVCLDAGAPIYESTIVIDADAIAETGAKYVRLNFILGSWDSPNDAAQHNGMTWMECYDSIVNSLVNRGVKVYGLIGAEAVKNAGKLNTDEYVDAYAKNFVMIVNHFKDRIRIFESFNEPNDWAGGTTSQLEPYWFAKILKRLYTDVKLANGHENNKDWQVTLISGPLFGHDISDGYGDTGAEYLEEVYKAGINQLDWEGIKLTHGTYPLDGIGYHTYVRQGPNTKQSVIDRLTYNLDSIYNMVKKYEGENTSKKIWISECGWNTAHISELIQARSLSAAFKVFNEHPGVKFAAWFQIQDFGESNGWGIYRKAPFIEKNRKLSWNAFCNAARRYR